MSLDQHRKKAIKEFRDWFREDDEHVPYEWVIEKVEKLLEKFQAKLLRETLSKLAWTHTATGELPRAEDDLVTVLAGDYGSKECYRIIYSNVDGWLDCELGLSCEEPDFWQYIDPTPTEAP